MQILEEAGTPEPTQKSDSYQSDGSLTKGQIAGIAGIAIAGVIILVVGIILIVYLLRRPNPKDGEIEMSV